ncbi:MAG: hypothetical protein MJ249_17190, partial [Kiritimatiellae bacterium]|nr:hypothetical protein [Kiritimatiellia bacterium]
RRLEGDSAGVLAKGGERGYCGNQNKYVFHIEDIISKIRHSSYQLDVGFVAGGLWPPLLKKHSPTVLTTIESGPSTA